MTMVLGTAATFHWFRVRQGNTVLVTATVMYMLRTSSIFGSHNYLKPHQGLGCFLSVHPANISRAKLPRETEIQKEIRSGVVA